MLPEESKAKRQAFSINIPDDKKEAWAKVAKSHNRPMSWLFIDMVDRMIAANSIHIYQDSEPSPLPDVLAGYVSKSELQDILKAYTSPDDVQAMITAHSALLPFDHSSLPDSIALYIDHSISQLRLELLSASSKSVSKKPPSANK
jgi:hypothetical protein